MIKLAIIGAYGQVGQEFTKQLAANQPIYLGHTDIEVADRASVEFCLERLNYDAVINLAAFHNTDQCEEEQGLAFAVNATGACNVARVAAKDGKKVCFFSTDYVFGGDRNRRQPYTESDRAAC